MNTIKKSLFLLIFLLLSSGSAFSQDMFPIDNPRNRIAGLALFQTSSGAGVGGFYEKHISSSDKIGAIARLIVQRGENDYPVTYYDPYYGGRYTMERSDKRRISMLETYFSYKKLFFTDMIANNFRPYVQLNAGPVIAFDPPNVPEFKTRMKNISTAFTVGANINIGVDFLWDSSTSFSISFGYDYLKFRDKLDPPPKYEDYEPPYEAKSNYSGMIGVIRLGKKL
ncbi:MAG: hypothetical protein K9M80_03895 [Candidatus Marinimicrobia bacterium]|nr:hypothetical protein [Candidatus Neomarinimicrobiota bacterium]